MIQSQESTSRTSEIVRIVPVHGETVAVAESAAAPPQLTYRGGPLLTSVEVVTVFWGSAWQSQQTVIDRVNGFYDAILQSAFMDALAEYSVPGKTIGHGKRTGTATISTSDPGASLADSDIQAFLQNNIGSALPAATPNSLYMVYLPSGTSVSMGGGASCTTFCGYHDTINNAVFYGVLPYPDCSGCLGGLQAFDALTSVSSHELAEAITDPVPGTGWYDDANGEIGDICAWQTETIAGYTVQKEWSNSKGQCV